MTRLSGGLLAVGFAGLLMAQTVRSEDSIKGKVVFSGEVPKPTVIDLEAYPACKACAPGGKLLTADWVIDPETKGVQNVVVFLTDPKDPLAPIPHPNTKAILAKTVVIDQHCCTFVPRMTVLVEGQMLEVKNSSGMAHNATISQGQDMDPSPTVPPRKSFKVSGLKAIGKVGTVTCDIHPWMKAYVWTVPSPYFAVTDKLGNFEIKNVPPGDYRLVFWHESAGSLGKAKEGDALTMKKGGVDLGKVTAEVLKDK